MTTPAEWEAPYFEDLRPGQRFDTAPPLTLTSGAAAVHRALTGSRCPLALDQALAERLAGAELADPALVWDCSIGQSTVVTGRVIGNVFYRGLVLHRAPAIGDTLRTRVEVVALKQNRSPSGLALLRVTTRDQADRTVLDFLRCALLPLRDAEAGTGHAADVSAIAAPEAPGGPAAIATGWAQDEERGLGQDTPLQPGERRELEHFEVVDGAPALARLTLNLATAHLRVDPVRPRLVYGGHTIGMAASHASRLFPECLYIAGWQSCDHLEPVREGDGLRSAISVGQVEPVAGGWHLAHARCEVLATRDGGPVRVLDWRPFFLVR